MRFRLAWAETQPFRPGLIMLEDKLWQRTGLAYPAKVKCPKLLKAFGSDCSVEQIVTWLKEADCKSDIIIKPTHLLAGRGVIMMSPDGKIRQDFCCVT